MYGNGRFETLIVSIQMISPVKGKIVAIESDQGEWYQYQVSIQMISPVKGKTTILNPI